MGLFDQFPYTNFHELNLDWLIRLIKELENTVNNFVALNTIKYADPIQWNITTQYEANTVVVDPQTGTAYISTKAVPAGVNLTNTDYWSVIFTLDIFSANQNLTLRDDGGNTLASFASVAGDWLLWNGVLYKVSQNININEAYVVGYNIDRYTIEAFIADLKAYTDTLIGDLQNLTTTDKSNVVAAINELVSGLTTLNSYATAINTKLNNISLFNIKDYGAVGDNSTDDTAAINTCIAAAEAVRGLVFIPDGTYITDGVVINDYVDIFGPGLLKASDNCTQVVNINVPWFGTAQETEFEHSCNMTLNVDSDSKATYGIYAQCANHVFLRNSKIINAKDYGLYEYITNPEFVIDGIIIEGDGVDQTTGIVVGSDSKHNNIIMRDCFVAFECNYHSTITNVHAWIYKASLTPDSIFIKHTGQLLEINNAYADTYNYVFEKTSATGQIMANMILASVSTQFYDWVTNDVHPTFFKQTNSNDFMYSIFNNITFGGISGSFKSLLSNLSSSAAGLCVHRFTNIEMPSSFNEASIPAITGASDTAKCHIEFNLATHEAELSFLVAGTFSGATAFNIGITGPKHEIITTGTYTTVGNYYGSPAGVAKVYLNPNGGLTVDPDNNTAYTSFAFNLRYTFD